MTLDNDLAALRSALQDVAFEARKLPWAKERAWTPESHLGAANGLPAIDLHDLSVRLALKTLEAAVSLDLQTGGVVLITGRGRHTGGHSKLRTAILNALEAMAENGEAQFRPLGPGRVEVILEEDRVRRARPGMGLVFWLFVALLAAGIAASIWQALQNP